MINKVIREQNMSIVFMHQSLLTISCDNLDKKRRYSMIWLNTYLINIIHMARFFRSPISQLSQQGCALTAARKYLRFAYQKFAFFVKITDRCRIFGIFYKSIECRILVSFIWDQFDTPNKIHCNIACRVGSIIQLSERNLLYYFFFWTDLLKSLHVCLFRKIVSKQLCWRHFCKELTDVQIHLHICRTKV